MDRFLLSSYFKHNKKQLPFTKPLSFYQDICDLVYKISNMNFKINQKQFKSTEFTKDKKLTMQTLIDIFENKINIINVIKNASKPDANLLHKIISGKYLENQILPQTLYDFYNTQSALYLPITIAAIQGLDLYINGKEVNIDN